MATVPILFFFEGEGDIFGIMIIVHLPVAKFWAALIIGLHWLSEQVWSFTPTLTANNLDIVWVLTMLANCFQQAPDRRFWQRGKQHSSGSRSNLHFNFESSAWKKFNPSKHFPGLLSPRGAHRSGWREAFQDHQK